jgi:DNA-binding MarR family transcriptional regulator
MMYRLLGDNHMLEGLPFSAQVFLRALDGVRNRLASEAGVSVPELEALARVAESAGLRSAALVDYLELSRGAVDSVVDELVRRDLLSHAPGESEGAVILNLTPTGHSLMGAIYDAFQQTINAAAESLDADRRQGFESGMLKMARKLEAESEKP